MNSIMSGINPDNRRLPCPICAGISHKLLCKMTKVPVVALQFAHSFADAVVVQRGDIELVVCMSCGHVYNRAFQPHHSGYSIAEEDADVFPERQESRYRVLSERLVGSYALHDKSIAVFGGGAADFLRQVCDTGDNHGILYDPLRGTWGRLRIEDGSIELGAEGLYDGDLESFDMILYPGGLERVPSPVDTLRRAYQLLKVGGIAFVEVANGSMIFADMNIWDLNYEQFSYFSASSLQYALTASGFTEAKIRESFANEYLGADAVRGADRQPSAPEMNLTIDVARLPFRLSRMTTQWKQRSARWRYLSRRVVLWGAGAKAVSLLTMLRIRPGRGIDYVVSVDDRFVGRFIPGTGQQIVEPSFLKRYQPDLVLVMDEDCLASAKAKLHELVVRTNVVAISTLDEPDPLPQ
jgi:C-methyltransferase C-terminal domain/Methyltransferase domain